MILQRLLKTQDVLELLDCDENTLRAIVREGRLPRIQLSARSVRFDPADVAAYQASLIVPWSERINEPQPIGDCQPDRLGFVYFVRCQRCVKIGFTTEEDADMPERMKMLQTGCPYPLYLIAKVPGSHRIEKKIHRKLDHLRLRGEWFDMLPEMKAFLDAVKAGAELETLV